MDHPSRRGTALLIALATLILAVTATTTLARVATTRKLRHSMDLSTAIADDMLHASDAAIIHWLAKESPIVALPPEGTEPVIAVLHDQLLLNDMTCELLIAAWDQCGMVPLAQLRDDSPLRSVISNEVLHRVDSLNLTTSESVGMDLFLQAGSSSTDRIAVFPQSPDSEPLVFGEAPSSLVDQTDESIAPPLAIGACVATHNNAPTCINANTAPIELVEAVMRLAGSSGIEHIIDAREQGKPAPGSAPTSGTTSTPGGSSESAPRLVAQSNAWAFRIDIRIDSLQRSWWAVYTKTTSKRPNQTTWECIQRLAITE